jgi:hypothetical protein
MISPPPPCMCDRCIAARNDFDAGPVEAARVSWRWIVAFAVVVVVAIAMAMRGGS